MQYLRQKESVHTQLKNAGQEVMSAYGECSKKEICYFLYLKNFGLPCGKENIDKVQKIFKERGENISEVLTYMSIIEKMVTPVMTTTHTIVNDLNNLGYTVEHLSKKDVEGIKKLDSAKIPSVNCTSYAVVKGADGFTGVMAVRQGVIDTKTCPVKEVTCAKQSIPLVKKAEMVGEFLYLRKSKGFQVADMSDQFMINSGATALVTGVSSGSRKLINALQTIYKHIGRNIPDETLKGIRFSCEVEGALTQFYSQYFDYVRADNEKAKEYVDIGNKFEQAITGLYNQVGIDNDEDKGVFQTSIDSDGPFFDIVNPSMCMPKAIMGKAINNDNHTAEAMEAASAMLIMRSRRGKNYTEKSEQTRMLSSPFPLTREVYEAAVLRTNIEPHLYGYKKIRVHITEEKELTNTYERLFNALYMMNYAGEVIVDKTEAKNVINASEVREKKVKFEAFKDSFKYGNSKFSVRVVDNIMSEKDTPDTINLLFKQYGAIETSALDWTASYDKARANMDLSVYGKAVLFQVYLTDAELAYSTQGNVYESVAKHNLTAYRCNGTGFDKYEDYLDNIEDDYENKVLDFSCPEIIDSNNLRNYYYECILQNVIRSQYNITTQGFIESYGNVGIPLQYLNLRGMRYIKPRTIKLNGMDVEHFVRTGQPERLKEIMDCSPYSKAVIERNGLLEKARVQERENRGEKFTVPEPKGVDIVPQVTAVRVARKAQGGDGI